MATYGPASRKSTCGSDPSADRPSSIVSRRQIRGAARSFPVAFLSSGWYWRCGWTSARPSGTSFGCPPGPEFSGWCRPEPVHNLRRCAAPHDPRCSSPRFLRRRSYLFRAVAAPCAIPSKWGVDSAGSTAPLVLLGRSFASIEDRGLKLQLARPDRQPRLLDTRERPPSVLSNARAASLPERPFDTDVVVP